jgi:micrococcal nuclease
VYEYSCSVVKVIDGDTVRLNVDLGCDVNLRLTVRLAGIDAPEISTNAGKVAKAFAEDWLEKRPTLVVHTVKDHKEKYGRYLGWIYSVEELQSDAGAVSLNDKLVQEGLARVYTGGPRG